MPERTTHLTKTVVEQVPKVFRLESIKSRIVALALLATLVPSLGMAWISYVQNRAALTDKISEELQSVSAQTARELDLWFKERLYDVRVFASSYEVTENVERARATDGGGQAGARLSDYLTSVEEQFPDYEELIVIDREGQPIATSADSPGDVNLPPDWLDRVAADQVVRKIFSDSRGRFGGALVKAVDTGDPFELAPENVERKNFLQVLYAGRWIFSATGAFPLARRIIREVPWYRSGPLGTVS